MDGFEAEQLEILKDVICDWAEDNDLAKLPLLFAEHMVEYAKELLGIEK